MQRNGRRDGTERRNQLGIHLMIRERWERRERRGVLENYDHVPLPAERKRSATNKGSVSVSRRGMADKGIGPVPGVSDAGSAATATVSHPAEHTRDRDRGDGISISPSGTSRKGELAQIARK